MIYKLAANLTALVHLSFILFVLFGATLGCRSRIWRILHLASMAYGVFIEIFYWDCPLTMLEQHLREKSGTGIYHEPFIQHYVNKVIYLDVPQWWLILAAALVLGGNLGLYAYCWRRGGNPPQRHGSTESFKG